MRVIKLDRTDLVGSLYRTEQAATGLHLRPETTPLRAMDVGVQLCLRAGYALRHYQPECQLRRKQTFGLTC